MPRLSVFESVSIDGYFAAPKGDMRWTHAGNDDPEYQAFVAGNAQDGGCLMFGRVTYDMMSQYWPTTAAIAQNPAVAGAMNEMPKLVFSRTMKAAAWNNTRLV